MSKLIADSRIKLSATYLAIIMVMCLGFSGVIYRTSLNELARPIAGDRLEFLRDQDGDVIGIARPGPSRRSLFDDFQKQRSKEARSELVRKLILLNISALILGAWFSYYLAKRTLVPIHAAMDAQTRFVSDASHELRTPLTALQTTNEVALRRKVISDDDTRKLLQDNINEVEKLRALSDSLLSQIKSGQAELSLSKVKLLDVVEESLAATRKIAEAKKIVIENQTSAVAVRANKSALAQIITILTDNAIKYSNANSKITIYSKTKASHVELSIKDQGIGIATKDLPNIFDRFYRADQSRNKSKAVGYGLGLSIAKDLAERQNAAITAISQPGKGSTFSVILKKA